MRVLRIFLAALLVLALVGTIGVGLLVHIGFRATATPPAIEATLARTMRNAAIPRSERDQKNPIEPTSEATQKGREAFLRECASCHGIDGSGKTQVGLNLYPRVPDLRATGTQSLSDGTIHYIIENGVQLTGMPAWGNSRQAVNGDSWKLVLYIRSLRPLAKQEQVQQEQTSASARYAGSQACEKCRAEVYEHWRKTPMANVVRDLRQHPDAIIPDLATNNVYKFSKD